MAEAVRMPKMSDTMTEGVLAKWHKKVGDTVKTGELVAEIETDKATMDFESFQEGTVLYIGPKEGEAVPIDGLIAVLGKKGEDFSALLEGKTKEVASLQDTSTPLNSTTLLSTNNLSQIGEPPKMDSSANGHEISHNNTHLENDGNRIKASPLAKKIAQEKGIDLHLIKGSAEHGRIIKRDLEAVDGQKQNTKPDQILDTKPKMLNESLSYEDIPVSQMRKTIAKRLTESLFTAPHFYLTMAIDMDKAIELRKQINEAMESKISFNDLVIKAVAKSLKLHPKVNTSWLGDKIRVNHTINIGVAVAVEEGLLVPVIRNADHKGISDISIEVKDLAKRAKEKKLQPSDWDGSTFTISNLGMFGLEEFTAIINAPDACILAVGAIQSVPVVKNNAIVPGNIMKVTLSCDHRVVDGAIGSAFLQSLKNLLESPLSILV